MTVCEPRAATVGAPRRYRHAPNQSQQLEEEDGDSINEIADRAIHYNDFDLVTKQNAQRVIARIREVQREATEKYDYELADLAETALNRTVRVKTQRTVEEINTAETEDMENKLEATRNDLGYLREHWQAVLQAAARQRDEDLAQLESEQREELSQFDANVEEGELPVQFRKMSPEFLQLKRKQRAMIASKRYLDAKEIKREVDDLEQRELKRNRERFKEKSEADRRELVRRQQEKLEARRTVWARRINEIQKQARYEIGHAQRSANHLEGKINEREQMLETAAMIIRGETAKPRGLKQGTRASQFATSEQLMFRQRAMINKFTYSKVFVPKVRKTPKTAR